VTGAILAVGIGMLAVVAHDGSPRWQIARAAVTVALTALAVRAARAGGRRRGLVAFSIGLPATAVGVGIGLPYLSKTGLTGITVAGLTVFFAGLILFVVGAAAVVRLVQGWRRFVVGPALILAVSLAVLAFGQAIAATNVPPTSLGSRTPADVGLRYEDVGFRTADDVMLSGWYVPSRNGAAVVMLHGSGSTRSTLIDRAAVLARHAYGVLLVDARGHGRSGGRAMDFGWYGDEDVAAAVTFLESRPDVDADRIAVLGTSMGGEEAIGAAAGDDRIKAVVAEGATNRTTGDKAWLSDAYGWRGSVQEGLEWLIYNTADLLTDADQPSTLRRAAEAAAPRPLLLIAGGAMPDEGKAGRYIQQAAPDSVELWVVPDSGHTQAPDTHPTEWEQRVTRFLDDALSERAPS
jgi:dienelactone hydrolase